MAGIELTGFGHSHKIFLSADMRPLPVGRAVQNPSGDVEYFFPPLASCTCPLVPPPAEPPGISRKSPQSTPGKTFFHHALSSRLDNSRTKPITNDRTKPVTNDRAQIINLEFTTDARNASDHLTMSLSTQSARGIEKDTLHPAPAGQSSFGKDPPRPMAQTSARPDPPRGPKSSWHMPPGLPGKMPRSCPQGTSREVHPAGSS